MKTHQEIQHITLEIKSSFKEFTYKLEKALGILNPAMLASLESVPASMASFLNEDGEEDSLVLFNIVEFDELLKLKGHRHNIKQYQVGNAAMVIKIAQLHPTAGLYLPVRLLVYENLIGKTIVEYDLPSSLIAPSQDELIREVWLKLDKKIHSLILSAGKETFGFHDETENY